ncbi:polymorphic toxin-type HINT domain-containing protein [Streptantibioticus silvisoli]|uniref:Polymorphic toxin-type HINT domain-containing protein n=1 Tax=Streptantibioticus silvisoli TaxID=2705255 RepID=A0ABT6VXM7_9ACTN|nr:polymorphic toxin-type HINT domain-containing protein [Streptantibioticus silvisoli]MDI5963241.1 polymorphic toxin-type HINT domain-containing protein [Streptantibioticus silvisoli]
MGGTPDATTNLENLGAREYDPADGRFISADPVFESADPNQLGGYDYAGNDPVTGSDPSGQIYLTNGSGDPVAEASAYGAVSLNGSSGTSAGQYITRFSAAVVHRQYLFDTAAPVAKRPDRSSVAEYLKDSEKFGEGLLEGLIGPSITMMPDGHGGHTPSLDDPDIASGPSGAGDLIGEILDSLDDPFAGVSECYSFAPTTPVLLSDGRTKPIGKVKAGDSVKTGDYLTGKPKGSQQVTAVHINDDTDLLDLTVRTGDGHLSTVHTTGNHPVWDVTRHLWVPAGQLKPGERLGTTTHTVVRVAAVHRVAGTAHRWNLTVADLHTYYVMAGVTPVLVHNCNTTVYRFQTDHPDSQRLSVDAHGDISISGDGMLHLNMSGNIAHTEQFRGSGGQIIAFDVPSSYVAKVRSAAIDQRRPSGMSRRQWNIFSSGRPQIDDPAKGPDLYGLPSEMFPGLLRAIIPGSGRVL